MYRQPLSRLIWIILDASPMGNQRLSQSVLCTLSFMHLGDLFVNITMNSKFIFGF